MLADSKHVMIKRSKLGLSQSFGCLLEVNACLRLFVGTATDVDGRVVILIHDCTNLGLQAFQKVVNLLLFLQTELVLGIRSGCRSSSGGGSNKFTVYDRSIVDDI